jgi:hypothetical protein
MRYAALLSVLVLLIALPAVGEVVTNEKVPFNIAVFVSCANGGLGEVIVVGGPLHVKSSVTIDQSGGLHVQQHNQPMGIAGAGLVTGDKYQGTGVTRSGFNVDTVDGWPYVYTFVNNFRMIGQGPGNNFTVHTVNHVTINANGTVTSLVTLSNVECK